MMTDLKFSPSAPGFPPVPLSEAGVSHQGSVSDLSIDDSKAGSSAENVPLESSPTRENTSPPGEQAASPTLPEPVVTAAEKRKIAETETETEDDSSSSTFQQLPVRTSRTKNPSPVLLLKKKVTKSSVSLRQSRWLLFRNLLLLLNLFRRNLKHQTEPQKRTTRQEQKKESQLRNRRWMKRKKRKKTRLIGEVNNLLGRRPFEMCIRWHIRPCRSSTG
jgi:hypothetical protein